MEVNQSMPKNPNWTRDELILALDLYFRLNPLHTSKTNKEIIELSELLNELPIHPGSGNIEKFRNPSGVYMKLCNFLRLDPSYTGKGLSAGSKLDEEIWDEFADNKEKLHKVATLIRTQYDLIPIVKDEQQDINQDEEFPEGRILTKLHQYRERNAKAVRSKKQIVLKRDGKLICEVCGFDYQARYGELGKEFAECHHTIPVSELMPEQGTIMQDLAIVCANCHRMLHRSKKTLSIQGLRGIIRSSLAG
jgi:5-methylcytosine-specific restriction enzyme A